MGGGNGSAAGSAVFLTGLAVLSQLLSFGYRVVLSRMVTFRQKRRKLKSGERSERHGT